MALAIANRYARALADIVLTPSAGLEPAVALSQVRDFAGAMKDSAELRNVLLSPAVSTPRKHSVVAKLGDSIGLHKLVRNFLWVVIDHRRIGSIDEIAGALETELDARLGRVRAQVKSAFELAQSDRDALAAELGRKTGKQVRCEFEVDPTLVGGVLVRIGSTIWDGSVRGQLDALRGRLAG
ncbi:MAG: ATP synthase F1 subunit delta [Bryobacteraceae bacterium]